MTLVRCPACHSELDFELNVVRIAPPPAQTQLATVTRSVVPGRTRLLDVSEPVCEAVEQVCQQAGISLTALRSPSRSTALVRARKRAILAAHRAGGSLTEIGRLLGRDHSTIHHHLSLARAATGEAA